MEYSAASEEEIRDRAVESLKRKRALRTQIGMWLLISYGPQRRPISESDIARESDRLRR